MFRYDSFSDALEISLHELTGDGPVLLGYVSTWDRFDFKPQTMLIINYNHAEHRSITHDNDADIRLGMRERSFDTNVQSTRQKSQSCSKT